MALSHFFYSRQYLYTKDRFEEAACTPTLRSDNQNLISLMDPGLRDHGRTWVLARQATHFVFFPSPCSIIVASRSSPRPRGHWPSRKALISGIGRHAAGSSDRLGGSSCAAVHGHRDTCKRDWRWCKSALLADSAATSAFKEDLGETFRCLHRK
jgi:hypothetical protein